MRHLLLLPALLLAAASCDRDDASCPTTPGTICTWAGDGEAGFNGDDEPLSAARFYWPIDVTITKIIEIDAVLGAVHDLVVPELRVDPANQLDRRETAEAPR